MSEPDPSPRTVGHVLRRLATLDAERIMLMDQLREMGFRSRGLVGEYGELIAAAVYERAERAPPSQPGYDLLVAQIGRAQVKTFRSTPSNSRTSMGVMREPYDVLFALRLDADFVPTAAWEIPRAAVEAVYPHGNRTSLTARLARQHGVREIPVERLSAAAEVVAGGELRLESSGGVRPSPAVRDDALGKRPEAPLVKRSDFTSAEADTIRAQLRLLRRAERDAQKRIRQGLRRMGFYITDYTDSAEGFTERLQRLGEARHHHDTD